MRGKSHVVISSLMCQTVSTALFNNYSIVPLIVGGIYATIPDVDHFNSMITHKILKVLPFRIRKPKRRKITVAILLVMLSTILAVITTNPFIPLISMFTSYLALTKHRRLSHSLLATAIITLLTIFGFGILIGFYACLGYLLHIMEDLLTYEGVPLLYPFIKRRYSIPIMRVNTPFGNTVEYLLIVLSMLVCAYYYR